MNKHFGYNPIAKTRPKHDNLEPEPKPQPVPQVPTKVTVSNEPKITTSEGVNISTKWARKNLIYDIPEPVNYKVMSNDEKTVFLENRIRHLQEVREDLSSEVSKLEETILKALDELTKVSKESHRAKTKDKKKVSPLPTASSMFGVNLSVILDREKRDIPSLITACVDFITESDIISTEGIFRVSPSRSALIDLRESIEATGKYDFSQREDCSGDPYLVPGLLKRFCNEMPEPLFPYDCYTCFLSAYGVPDKELRLKKFKDVISMFLPRKNWNVLRYLFAFLHEVAHHSQQNKMGYDNLGTCFAPLLLRDSGEYDPINESIMISRIVSSMIEHYEDLFTTPPPDS